MPGRLSVSAPQVTITTGAEIASTTAGTGAGGSVECDDSGALVLDGPGVAETQIAASATGRAIRAGRLGDGRGQQSDRRGRGADRQLHRRAGQGRQCRRHRGEWRDVVGRRPERRERDHRLGSAGVERPSGRSGVEAGGAIALSGGAR